MGKKPSLREAAKRAPRTPITGGRMNRNDAMGPAFVEDLRQTIADQMRVDPHDRLSVRQLFALVQQEYPEYPNQYSAFRIWMLQKFGYRGGETLPEELNFDLAEYPTDPDAE